MAKASDNLFPKVIMEEVATDGSATTTPAADHRALFLGEDGALHLKDSGATVTDIGGSGDVASDAIWDAKGDLAVGTGANTADNLATAANGAALITASGETTGLKWRLNNDGAAVAPAVTDDSGDGYAVGSRWIDTTNDKEYVCLDASVGAAVWTETTAAAAGGASDWTATVTKSADESVTASTADQDDDHLFFTTVSGTPYLTQVVLIYASPLGGTTPGLRIQLGEDAAAMRGTSAAIAINSVTSFGHQPGVIALTAQTAATKRILRLDGWHVGNGGTFKLIWSQNTSNGNPTTVYAGSFIRYKTL